MSEAVYAKRIEYERILAGCFVNMLLDDLCRSLGLDPVKVWRLPHEAEGHPYIYDRAAA